MSGSEKIEAVFVGQEGGHDHYEGQVEGRRVLELDIRTGLELEDAETSVSWLITAAERRRTPTQPGTHHNWRTDDGVILDFSDPDVSNEITIDFLEQVIEMVRDGASESWE
ncbi:MAG: hypothetical protein PHN90_05500 [Methanothrix sp.]|nr:hypothetical protein [Methanothrix sp.]